MSLLTLLPFIVLIGAMFLMTRSAKKKQQQAIDMRNQMQPGSGVRTIGGMYATVKEVGDETVLLDAGPGVELLFAKNSIGAVLTDDEYNRIVHGIEHDPRSDADVVPDDASSLTETGDDDSVSDTPVEFEKKDAAEVSADTTDADTTDVEPADAGTGVVDKVKTDEQAKKSDGGSEAK